MHLYLTTFYCRHSYFFFFFFFHKTKVVLDNGETVVADIVVTGVGVVPDTDFLSGSNLTRNKAGCVEVNEVLCHLFYIDVS